MKKPFPNEAQELFDKAKRMAQLRYKIYVRITKIKERCRQDIKFVAKKL